MVKNLPAMQETWVRSLNQKNTLEKGYLPGEFQAGEDPGKLQSMESESETPEQLTASQVALVVKNLPAGARGIKDVGLIPGSPGEGNGYLL